MATVSGVRSIQPEGGREVKSVRIESSFTRVGWHAATVDGERPEAGGARVLPGPPRISRYE